MAEDREWMIIDCVSYLFNSFAVYTDAELSEDEKRVIAQEIMKYVPDEGSDLAYGSLNKTLKWFNEDVKSDIDGNKLGTPDSVVIGTFVNIAATIKENYDSNGCQAIHDDLVRIGKADGHYDDVEKHWAKSFAEMTGCKH